MSESDNVVSRVVNAAINSRNRHAGADGAELTPVMMPVWASLKRETQPPLGCGRVLSRRITKV